MFTALTGNELLSIVIPALTRRSKSVRESSSIPDNRTYPITISYWEDFDNQTLNFHLLDAIILNPLVMQLDPLSRSVCRESHMENKFVSTVTENLTKLKDSIGFIDKLSNCDVVSKIGHYDICCWSNDKINAVGELKLFWNLEDMPDDAASIIDLYTHSRDYDYNYEGIDARRKWWRALAQLYGYMIDQNIKYGFLSCFNRTWFVLAGGQNYNISISNAVHCDSGNCLRAFAYFMHRSKLDESAFIVNNPRRYSYSDDDSSIEEKSNSEGSHSSDESFVGPVSRKRGLDSDNEPSGRRHEPGNKHSSISSEVSLSQVSDFKWLGSGRLGSVYGGNYDGIHLAIKCVDIVKGDGCTLSKERKMYERMSALQGVCIPRLFPHQFRSCSGLMVGFGVDLMLPLPAEIEQWSTEVRRGAYDALLVLALAGGILHNDIRSSNFGQMQVDGRVMVFDLEDVSEFEESRFKVYKRSIQRMFL